MTTCCYSCVGRCSSCAELLCAVQFYLGTTRLQLEHKGGADHIVTSIANVVPAFGFIGIPVIGWLLDRMGYGITLATINFLGVLASFFQAMPNVWFQVWCCLRCSGCSGMLALTLSEAVCQCLVSRFLYASPKVLAWLPCPKKCQQHWHQCSLRVAKVGATAASSAGMTKAQLAHG